MSKSAAAAAQRLIERNYGGKWTKSGLLIAIYGSHTTWVRMLDLNEIAILCDKAIFKGNGAELQKAIGLLENWLTSDKLKERECYAHYLLGNIYAKLSTISGESAGGWRQDKYPAHLTAEINHLRHAKSLISKSTKAISNEIRTNLSNALAHQRRSVEVLEDWHCDFKVSGDSPFVSSLAKAKELVWISRWLNDRSHTHLYQYEAYLLLKDLKSNISKTDHYKVRAALENDPIVLHLLQVGDERFEPLEGWQNKYNGDSYDTDERKYRAWCLNNRLFVNPINDITTQWIADRDILGFPNHVVSVGDGPFFAAAFSALKREYCFARYMAFEGIHEIHPAYENEQLFLVNTLDYVHYSGSIEKTKTAFRICFSVLDSIASLMRAYFQCNKGRPEFKPDWIKNNFSTQDMNHFVDALYWLSHDLFDDKKQGNSQLKAPNPAASEIRNIRNAIEHRWLRVAEQKQTIWDKHNDFAHVITSGDLQKQTLFLLKLVRSAILYLCMAVAYNEKNNKKSKGQIISATLPMVDDEFVSF